MSTRLMQIVVPRDRVDDLNSLLDANDATQRWVTEVMDDLAVASVPIDSAISETLTDALEKRFASAEPFSILLMPVEALLPRTEEDPDGPEADIEDMPRTKMLLGRRVSREELYEDIRDSIRAWPMFLTMTALSTIVAALGLAKNDVAVVIGAMVIAPLLGPNIGLALATTLGDISLGIRTLRINVGGVTAAVTLAAALALVMHVDPSADELFRRTQVSTMDIVIALAAGAAGSLAFTSGISTAFIGVMVAVALLPPAAALGLMIGSGEWRLASGAALLLSINVISINLASTVTFLIQGIRPARWSERSMARRATIIAVCMWIVALGGLVTLTLVAKHNGFFEVDIPAIELEEQGT